MKLLNASVSNRKLPVNLIEEDFVLFEGEVRKSLEETRLLTLRDVSISSEGLIFKGINILRESYSKDFVYHSSIETLKTHVKSLIKNYLLRKRVVLEEDGYLWITDEQSYNYFHWLLDAVPRLVVASDKIEKPKIILPYSFKKIRFIADSLKALPVSNVRYISKNEVCKLDKLLIPTHIASAGDYNDDIVKRVRQIYRGYYVNKQSIYLGDKIYISRAKATKRRILNEEELISLLKQYDFEIVVFEELSFDEQVSIVFNVKYLISNHGAGLTNMLFMEADSSVLELRKEGDKYNNCYFALASALNIKYYYQTCKFDSKKSNAIPQLSLEPTAKEFKLLEQFTHIDMVVDVEKLEASVKHMLNSV